MYDKTNGRCFSAVLVPLEPTDGCDRLQHMLKDAKPAVVLTAFHCDLERLQEIIINVQSSLADEDDDDDDDDDASNIPTTGDNAVSSQGLYRPKQIKVMDIRDWLRESIMSSQAHQLEDVRGRFDRILSSLDLS